MKRLQVVEEVSGNIFLRKHEDWCAGQRMDGHIHHFDHTTIVFVGAVHVRRTHPDGTVDRKDFYAPSHFLVKADVHHEITALENETTFWCVYSHRDHQGQITQESTGWLPAVS